MAQKNFNSIDEILEFAIKSEIEAYELYMELSRQAKSKEMQRVFAEYAQEEVRHKQKIEKIKVTGSFKVNSKEVKDLMIADYLVSSKITPEMTYQDALIISMKKEKAAFLLYTNLAERTDDPTMKDLFLTLAQEEAKHKLRFELEYDRNILLEN